MWHNEGYIMLKLIHSMKELDFSALMEVYIEGNRENGGDLYPDLSEGQRILRAEQDFHQYLRECFFPTPGAVYCVWEAEGCYVSALRLEPYQDGLLLEALETAPDRRRQGYALRLMEAALGRFGAEKIYSHISRRNSASIGLHAYCGFHKILDHCVYADGSVSWHTDTYLYEKEDL